MKSVYIVLLLFILSPLSAYANVGGGSTGTRGGEVVIIDGKPELYDLATQSTCDWRTGEFLLQLAPETDKILHRLAQVDWYFAEDLHQEILYLMYCLTGPLKKIHDPDQDALTATVNETTKQAAVRLNSEVYVDFGIFKRMTPSRKAYLLIHEAMHSYLRLNEVRRKHKLVSIVKSVYRVVQDSTLTTDYFHLQMEKNSIQFPQTSQELTDHQDAVRYLIGNEKTRREILLEQQDLGEFYRQLEAIPAEFLSWGHASLLQEIREKDPLTTDISNACTHGDLLLAKKFIQSNALGDIAPIAICFGQDKVWENEGFLKELIQLPEIQDLSESILGRLARKEPRIEDGRFVVDPGLALLSKTSDVRKPIPFTELAGISKGEVTLMNAEMLGWWRYIAWHLNHGRIAEALSLSVHHPLFYPAFRSTEIAQALQELKFPSALEKKIAKEKLPLFFKGFWGAVVHLLEREVVEPAILQQFLNQIDSNSLGYPISSGGQS